MAHQMLERGVVVVRTLVLWSFLTLMLLRMYSLYIALALTPNRQWRRQLEFRFRRALFATQHLGPRRPSD